MSIIIGYLDLNKGIILVSKYWKIITLENKIKLVTDPEKRKPNELNYLENNRILVNQLKSEAGEKGKKIISMKDIISENNKNYSTLNQRLHKKIIERKTTKNNNNKNDNDIKTKKVYWEEEFSGQNGNYRSTNNDGNSDKTVKIIKNGKLVNGVNHRNEEENGKKEVVKEVEEENEEEEEEEEVDDTPRITIRTRKNVQNSNNNNNNNDDDGDGDGDILKRYGVETDENEEEEEEEEMKQISLSDDGYENDNTTQNNGYENKNENSPDKNKNKNEDKNENLTTISDTQKTVITENLTEITPSINGNEEDENRVSNYDHLLVHVKDIRSESQLTDLIEFIQDGYVTIETAAEEKKRLKRRIKGDFHHDIFLSIIFFLLYLKIIFNMIIDLIFFVDIIVFLMLHFLFK